MRYALILVALLAATPAYSQGTSVKLVNPSRLRAAYRGAEVILSWDAELDPPGGFAIYRSPESIGAASLSKALRAGLASAQDRSFVDHPEDRAAYFYAVLSLDASGSPLLSFESGKNTTARAVAIEPGAENPIEGLVASVESDAIRLRYRLAPEAGRLILYRGTSPFSDAASLLDAVLVSSFEDEGGSFLDYPVPGVDYWYALLQESELRAGRISFRAGSNASPRSVRIPAGLYRLGLPATPPLARTPPLPSFVLAAKGERPTAPGAATLRPETEKAVAAILAAYPASKPALPALLLLPEERGSPTGGEDYALALIVQGSLKRGDYPAAVEELKKYLSLNRSKDADARARFYLGEALAHKGSYREAVFEFLRARSRYAAETRAWIEYLMSELRKG